MRILTSIRFLSLLGAVVLLPPLMACSSTGMPVKEPDLNSGFTFPMPDEVAWRTPLEAELDAAFVDKANKHIEAGHSVVAIRNAYKTAIQSAWSSQDFAALEEYLTNFKEIIAPTFEDGEPTQPLYYDAIVTAGMAQEQQEPKFSFEKQIDQWRKAYPESIAPEISLAEYYKAKAWQVRGGDLAADTPYESLAKFDEVLQQAYAVLESARKQGKTPDPQFYATEIGVLLGLSALSDAIQKEFQQGLRLDPTYMPLYNAMAMVLLPRWGGDNDDLESLARMAAAYNHNSDSVYTYIVGNPLGGMTYTPAEFLAANFSWARIKSGFIQQAKQRGLTTFQLDKFSWMAVANNDRETAKVLFDALAHTHYRSIWGSRGAVEQAEAWANGTEAENPLRR